MSHAYLALRLICRDGVSSPPLPIRQRVGDVLLEYSERVWWASANLCCLEVVLSRAADGCGFPTDVLAERLSTLFAVDVTGGLASTADLALLAATLAPARQYLHVPAGNEEAFLSGLSLRRLPDVDEETVTLLSELGLRTVGSLTDLEERGLIRLLGPTRGRMLHLQAQGRGLYPRLSPVTDCSVTVNAECDPDPEALPALLRQAAIQITADLQAGNMLAGHVTLILTGAHERVLRLERSLKERTNQAAPLVGLTEAWLLDERVRQSRWQAVGLTAGDLTPVVAGQMMLWPGSSARTAQIEAAAARLASRYGGPALFRSARAAPSPLSEEAFVLVPVGSPQKEPRPLGVQPIEVRAKAGTPLAILWHNRWQGVQEILRHWRVTWNWWRAPQQQREYFLVETVSGGRRAIICDLTTLRWFVGRVSMVEESDGLYTSAHSLQL